MNQIHHFADLPTLKEDLERQLSPDWKTMPWLLRQGFRRRLEADGLRRDVFVFIVCFAPVLAAAYYGNYRVLSSQMGTSLAAITSELVAATVLALAGWMGLKAASRYLGWRNPASKVDLCCLYALVQTDKRAGAYVHALLDGNESLRSVDCEVCYFIAGTRGQAVPALGCKQISVWSFWDWHYGVSYTGSSDKTARAGDASEGLVRSKLRGQGHLRREEVLADER